MGLADGEIRTNTGTVRPANEVSRGNVEMFEQSIQVFVIPILRALDRRIRLSVPSQVVSKNTEALS